MNELFNLFTKQPLLPLLARILKKKAELQVTKGTRDLFRRLLFLSATNSIDLESVFPFLFSQIQRVFHTQMEQLNKIISQQFFTI